MQDVFAELRDMSPAQRELMLSMLANDGVDISRLPLPRRRDESVAPMSAAQKRLWTMHQLSIGQPTENVPVAIELSGEINAEALLASVNFVIGMHEILRTTFHEVEGVLTQLVHNHDSRDIAIPLIDLAVASKPNPQKINDALIAHGSELFNLETDWLIRPALFRLAANEHILQLTLHQLVVDGWSVNILLEQISFAYAALADGAAPDLQAAAIQYPDMAEWQQDGWESGALAGQVNYWVQRLEGAPVTMEIPVGRTRPTVPAFTGAIKIFQIDQAETSSLRELTQREGVTLFTGVLASLKVLLAAYTGSADIVVGTLISRRSRPETEMMIGNFGNNLLLRSVIPSDMTFRQVLHAVNDTTLDAMANQDAPLELVNEKLQQAVGQRIPAFQIGFIFRDGSAKDRLKMPGVQVSQRFVDIGTARLDLWFDLGVQGELLSGEIQYRNDLYDPEQVNKIVEHLQHAIALVTANPDRPLTAHEIFVGGEGLSISQGQAVNFILSDHPLIEQCRVIVAGPLSSGPTLIQYVLNKSAALTGTELRSWLESNLEFSLGAMLFREVDALLDDTPGRGRETRSQQVADLSDFESRIRDIWKKELGVKFIGPNDNFFDLGGHSLLAVEVLKAMQTIGSMPPDPKSLVTGTLRQLARQMEGHSSSINEQPDGAKVKGRSWIGRITARLT